MGPVATRMMDRWRVAIRPRRAIARVRVTFALKDEPTVVVVNWNSLHFLTTCIRGIRYFSPPGTNIIVVDNASTDESVAWLQLEGVRTIELPTNVGHGPGLDLGILSARSEFVIVLDVDAFPIDGSWLEELIQPLHAGATLVGARGGDFIDNLGREQPQGWGGRQFVHPCCAAFRLRHFVRQRRTFVRSTQNGRLIDPGEAFSQQEQGHINFLEPTSTVGPGALGTVFGDVVYHNFYGVRHRRQGTEEIDGIASSKAAEVWAASVHRYFGDTPDVPHSE